MENALKHMTENRMQNTWTQKKSHHLLQYIKKYTLSCTWHWLWILRLCLVVVQGVKTISYCFSRGRGELCTCNFYSMVQICCWVTAVAATNTVCISVGAFSVLTTDKIKNDMIVGITARLQSLAPFLLSHTSWEPAARLYSIRAWRNISGVNSQHSFHQVKQRFSTGWSGSCLDWVAA